MNKLSAFFAVLRYGSSLTDSATWKVRQNLINTLVGLLGALAVVVTLFGVDLNVSTDDLMAIAGGIASIWGLFNSYITTATTDKIGVPAVDSPADRPTEVTRDNTDIERPIYLDKSD